MSLSPNISSLTPAWPQALSKPATFDRHCSPQPAQGPFSWVRFTVQETLTSATSKAGRQAKFRANQMEVSRERFAYSDCSLRKRLSKLQELCEIISEAPGQEQACSRDTQGQGQRHTPEGFLCLEGNKPSSCLQLPRKSRAGHNHRLTAAPT